MVDKSKTYWVRSISGFVFFMIWIVFFMIRKNATSSLLVPLIVCIIGSIACLIGFFGSSYILNLFKKEEVKKSVNLSDDEIEELLAKEVSNLWTHKKIDEPIRRKTYNKGNNVIYEFKVPLLHQIKFGENDFSKYVYILINVTRREYKPTILSGNTSEAEIFSSVNLLSSKPDESPNVTKKITKLDQFNRPVEETEEIKYPEKKKEEEKGDII